MPRWLRRLLGMPGAVSFQRLQREVSASGKLESTFQSYGDDALREATRHAARSCLTADAGANGKQHMPLLLAGLREAARRSTGLRAHDEQLLACCALVRANAVEMDTGEGKTLVGALAAAAFALAGRHVHVLSVNDYLAERDATWMDPLFTLLGINASWVGQHTSREQRREHYRHPVVYAPVSEVGFDLLRDRFAASRTESLSPVFDVAIVDEADAVMIDEAMVPLVLAGTSGTPADDLGAATELISMLAADIDFTVDDDRATVTLTDAGLDRLEAALGGVNLFELEHAATLTNLNLALHARVLVHRDVDYLVTQAGIELINQGRGRIAHLQRWPDGLHAAIEAKEQLAASDAGMVLDSLTVQDLLGRYRTLSGMSGTITAVAEDLLEFYQLPAGRVERHVPSIRIDQADRVLPTREERDDHVIETALASHAQGRPVLIATQHVADAEHLAGILTERGLAPRLLTAKNDADEAAVIAEAGTSGAITVSTQMSGRGTDIRLGGPDGDAAPVRAAGGLAVIASGRFPSARLDAQLRGRAGRQGDPGSSVVVASLQDELVRANAPAHLLGSTAASMSEERRRAVVDAAQRISEGLRLDRHRATWAYARTIAAQRELVLELRADILDADGGMRLLQTASPDHADVLARADADQLASLAREIALFHLDDAWTEHLASLQEVRDGIHLRSLAGQRPTEEFNRIAATQFRSFREQLLHAIAATFARIGPEDLALTPSALGLRRPASTWTYMVSDDPLGSPGDRFVRALGQRWRSAVLGLEPSDSRPPSTPSAPSHQDDDGRGTAHTQPE